MKVSKLIVLLFAIAICIIVYSKKNLITENYDRSSANAYKSNIDELIHITEDYIENILREIDDRVLWINKKKASEGFSSTLKEGEYGEIWYDGNILAYRSFGTNVHSDLATGFDLYYDENGKLIYAEIAHYRSTLYYFYFKNDELLHIDSGLQPFVAGESFRNFDLEYVKGVVEENPKYDFVLEDIFLCLKNAYR